MKHLYSETVNPFDSQVTVKFKKSLLIRFASPQLFFFFQNRHEFCNNGLNIKLLKLYNYIKFKQQHKN